MHIFAHFTSILPLYWLTFQDWESVCVLERGELSWLLVLQMR